MPALIRKCHAARLAGDAHVSIWGTGRPTRKFLHVDDLADACLFLMRRYSEPAHINVGTGEEIAIADLAGLIRDLIAPGLALRFDPSKPDGAPRRRLDVSRINGVGWRHRTALEQGFRETCAWFRARAGTADLGRVRPE